MAFPKSFTDALRPHTDEIALALAKAGDNLRRWQRVVAELERLRAEFGAISVLGAAMDARLAEARLGARQMQDIIGGLEPLLAAVVEQGPPTLGALPALAWPLVAGALIVAGYGAVETIADAVTIISENEVKVAAYETQLGLAREVADARRACTGPQCAELDEAFNEIVSRDPTEDDGWAWWVWLLVLGLPLGGVLAYVFLSGQQRQARGQDKRGRR